MHLSLNKLEVPSWKSLLSLGSGRPFLLKVRSADWFIIATVSTAIFTDLFLYAVIVPVFPFSLVNRNGVAPENVQHWLTVLLAVYGAALLVGAPVCGWLADRVQYRKIPLLLGLVTIAGATLMLCLARSLALLIVARVLQGLSASVIWVVGLALLADTFSSDDIAQAMGYVGIAYSLATLVAPMLGGIVYERAGYYSVFGMTFGVIALDVVLRLAMIEKKVAAKWSDDGSGTASHELSAQVTCQTSGEGAAEAGLQEAVSDQVMTAGENIQQSHGDQQKKKANVVHGTAPKAKPRLPPIFTLWKSRRLLAGFWGTLVIASILTGLDTTLTLFVSRTFHWNSLAAGILYLAPLLPAFFSPAFGYLVDKYGTRYPATGGFLITIPFFVCLRFVTHDSLSQKVLLAAMLVGIGTGTAISLTALLAEFTVICNDKAEKHPGLFGPGGAYAQAYGIFNMSWAGGSLIGAFWSGGIYQAAGWGTLGWSFALLCGVSSIPTFLFTGGWVGKEIKEAKAERAPQNTSEPGEDRQTVKSGLD